jgi:succinyl-diaminopimelate desuccinylase
MSYEKAEKLLASFRDDIVKETIEQINIPSVSENISTVKEALEKFLAKAATYGFNTFITDSHGVGVVELGEGEETIGILVHLDVVDPGELSLWKKGPFDGVLEQGMIYGRGAIDDKGPAVVALHVMRALKELKLPLHKKVQLIVGTQEETTWEDMHEYVSNYKLPDYGFSPDGEFPIANREKGYMDVELEFCIDSQEKGPFEIISITSGYSNNAIPAKSEAVLKGNFKTLKAAQKSYNNDKICIKVEGETIIVSANGKAAHSSVPEHGDNAIYTMVDFLSTLNLSQNKGYYAVKFIKEKLSQDSFGKALGLYMENDYLEGEYVHRTTIVPTVLRTENSIKLTINMRIRYGTTKKIIEEIFDKIPREYNCSFKMLDYYDPLFVSKDKPFIKEMARAYEEVTGLENEFILAFGTTYAKAIGNMVSWGPLLPGDPDSTHDANECISVDTLMKAAHVYLKYLHDLVFSQDSYK